MNRIRTLLAERKERKLLIPFFTVGYPSLSQSRECCIAAANAGADIIELGMPFSDPLADGPAIQFSSHAALENGTTLQDVLSTVTELRRSIATPLVLMGYVNPILAYGMGRFLDASKLRGVDGLIVPDLPVEEASEYCMLMKKADLSTIFLVAPTSPRRRVNLIDKLSSDFVYAVTVTGVTGSRKSFSSSTDAYLSGLAGQLRHPFVAGFGVSSSTSAAFLARRTDGVVIGSALVELIRQTAPNQSAAKRVHRFLSGIRLSLDRL